VLLLHAWWGLTTLFIGACARLAAEPVWERAGVPADAPAVHGDTPRRREGPGTDLLDRLLGHDDWGARELFAACAALPEAELDREFDIGHRTLRATLRHMVRNVEAWTALMTGTPFSSTPDAFSLAVLQAWHERSFAAFAGFARTALCEGRLGETFTDAVGEQLSFGGAILHVVLHDAEHRTEAVHILERLGLTEPLELDHALWDHVSRGGLPGGD
jgi:uncharacterized damage-inducible protein DinB